MASVPKVEDSVQQAPFVFVATVVKVGAATVASFQVQAGTVIAKISRTLRTPDAVGNLAGTNITIQLIEPNGMKAGDEAIFFARGVVFAESIVVQEVAPRQMVTGTTKAAQVSTVNDAVVKLPDLNVQKHAGEVELVIVGKVVTVNLAEPPTPVPITHHDPFWQEAVVQVESVEVGILAQKTVSFLFPSSDDVKWHKVPKFKVGMEGVFLLHREQVKSLQKNSLVVLDPLDFHPRDRVDAIRKVLQKASPTTTPKKSPKRRGT